ncbi:FAD synthase [Babesia sp. Xinjiang]|uniref:FAD synthase n=1 Tax=Babesia sp. Xinjiang TaxID=462227 RepID=UPI000A23BA16|nr:FAD synthase [Babesia sp. Xinjiang]ORM40557.1 FAD synthase [Babesia sp. Xinjiang]
MASTWDRIEEFARILKAPIHRYVLRSDESDRMLTLIEQARQLLWRSYSQLGYENVYVSFNGGKDSVAVLHLHRLAALSNPKIFEIATGRPLNVVFFKDPKERLFPDITEFMERTAIKWNFSLRVIEATWDQGIPKLPAGGKKGFVLGCRNTDFDNVSLSDVEEGSAGGLEFQRIHPILNWTYGDVWNFLRLYALDYCPLYDLGYTSIGSADNTIANPHLKRADGTCAPAYMLEDWSLERCGRTNDHKKAENAK